MCQNQTSSYTKFMNFMNCKKWSICFSLLLKKKPQVFVHYQVTCMTMGHVYILDSRPSSIMHSSLTYLVETVTLLNIQWAWRCYAIENYKLIGPDWPPVLLRIKARVVVLILQIHTLVLQGHKRDSTLRWSLRPLGFLFWVSIYWVKGMTFIVYILPIFYTILSYCDTIY